MLPAPPATVKGKPAMSQNLRPPSGGERPSMSWAIKQKTGHGSEVQGAFGKNSCCGHDSSACDESKLAAAFAWLTTEYQLDRQTKTGHGSEVEAALGKNSCCVHDSNAWDESELAAALAPLTTEYQLGRRTKAGHGSEVEAGFA